MSSTRREFLAGAGAAAGGLVIAMHMPVARSAAPAPADLFKPNAWLEIARDGTITVWCSKSEMGQGVATSFPMIVADELEADWSKVKVEFAPADKAYWMYFSKDAGMQITGGSTSTKTTWPTLREAGATARAMLLAAAAKKWKVKESDCKLENGEALGPKGQKVGYGDLVDIAAKLPVPKKVTPKTKDFKFIGKRMARIDTPLKVRGQCTFGIDVKVPGMLVARVVRCPVFGGKAASFDAAAAKAVPGVKDVVQISGGVAVVAEGYWPATLGTRALKVKWDEGPNADLSSEKIRADFVALGQSQGKVVRTVGDVSKALAEAAHKVEAEYDIPLLAHATMEPQNATAHVRADGVDIWAPTQAQTFSQMAGAKISGLSPDKVKVHTTYLGGGFGRRSEVDFVVDALEASKAMKAPVKVIWSREDDTQHDFYRPPSWHKLAGAIDAEGNLTAWSQRIVGPSIMMRVFPAWVQEGVDPSSVEGAADLPYAVPNLTVDYHLASLAVPIGFWRSVGNSYNAFVTECFLDELCAAARKDPAEVRRKLLELQPRHKAVLELALDKANWGKKLPEGHGMGVAVHLSFNSVVAEVAEVSIDAKGYPKVHRVTCAVDCGRVVNPDTVEAQMQGGIAYGLSAALMGEITIKKGRVQQANFLDYKVLRMKDMPHVDVHVIPSDKDPTGVGEPGTPPIAAAVGNAIYAASGVRVRKLPFNQIRKA